MIRQPRNDEFNHVCPLLYQSGPEVFNWFFAADGAEEVCRYLKLLYDKPDNAFSKELIWVEEEGGDIRGSILALPGRDKHRLEKNIGIYGKEIGKLAGLRKSMKIIFRGRLGKYLSVIDEDEYYIGNLAVSGEHRGKNIGPALLDAVSAVAAAAGYGKLSLLVVTENDRARHVYDKYGFRTVMKVELPRKYQRHGITSFLKVVKEL